jgi:hypothetical protein
VTRSGGRRYRRQMRIPSTPLDPTRKTALEGIPTVRVAADGGKSMFTSGLPYDHTWVTLR